MPFYRPNQTQMRTLMLLAVLFAGTTCALAQDNRRPGKVIRDPDGNFAVLIATQDGGRVIPYDEYFGADAEGMRGPIRIADANLLHDQFRWEAKLSADGWNNNSCSKASENIINDVIEFEALPQGWEIRQVGTLGNLTTFENATIGPLAGRADAWWNSKPYRDEFDLTNPNDYVNPPSYAHTTTVVKSPDGNYYVVDNWHGDLEIKRVYPVGDVPDNEFAEFLSRVPDETLNIDANYRLHRSGLGKYFDQPPGPDDPVDPPEVRVSTPPPTSEEVPVEVLQSADPNDKTGLLGVGTEHYFTPDGPMFYTIRFENKADASAPAQEVLVRDTLDAGVFDLSTFQLGEIQFGSRHVSVPPGRSSFSTRVALGDGPLEVLINASLVEETGIVTWRFTTLDTRTGDLPFDPLDGFLPPNRTSPEGEGSVAFRVTAREGLSNGTEIRNQARIIFDLNEPIDTPPWSNTVDLNPPTSRVTDLGDVQSESVFTVRWDGDDAEAGVSTYDVYVSVNGGAFDQWLRRVPVTEERFAGDSDSTYAFYSIAYDGVGNVEPAKTEADATTAVSVASEAAASVPDVLTLVAPFPNPSPGRGEVALRFGLPVSGRADLRVYDVRGRELAALVDEERAAGWHAVRWGVDGLASGVYVVRLRSEGQMQTRTVTVAR